MNFTSTSACVGGRYAPASMPIAALAIPRALQSIEIEGFDALTHRERQTVELLIKHGICKLVAAEMEISMKTVEQHLHRARVKTGHRNFIHLTFAFARWAQEQGRFE
jgi:DNA-binding CsgD family transcriptional regulator